MQGKIIAKIKEWQGRQTLIKHLYEEEEDKKETDTKHGIHDINCHWKSVQHTYITGVDNQT